MKRSRKASAKEEEERTKVTEAENANEDKSKKNSMAGKATTDDVEGDGSDEVIFINAIFWQFGSQLWFKSISSIQDSSVPSSPTPSIASSLDDFERGGGKNKTVLLVSNENNLRLGPLLLLYTGSFVFQIRLFSLLQMDIPELEGLWSPTKEMAEAAEDR